MLRLRELALTSTSETERKAEKQCQHHAADDRDVQVKEEVQKNQNNDKNNQLPEIVLRHSRGFHSDGL